MAAHAAPLTVNFSGVVEQGSFGIASGASVRGSFTFDTDAVPLSAGETPRGAYSRTYDVLGFEIDFGAGHAYVASHAPVNVEA